MVVRLFVASREVFVASRRNYEITAVFFLQKTLSKKPWQEAPFLFS